MEKDIIHMITISNILGFAKGWVNKRLGKRLKRQEKESG